MKNIIFLSFIFVLVACSQDKKHIQTIYKNKSKTQYIDFVLHNNSIIALSKNGKVVKFNRKNGYKKLLDFHLNATFTHIAIDKRNNIVVSDTTNVYRIKNNRAHKIYRSKYVINGMVFNKRNQCFLITNNGVLNTKNSYLYFPKKSLNKYVRKMEKWFRKPYFLMDKKDNIWIGFGYGEWGGDLYIFNTKTKTFIRPKIDDYFVSTSPIKSFAQGENTVYVGSGLMHFWPSGKIIYFDNFKSKKVFTSESYIKKGNSKEEVQGHYIGPIYYFDNHLYFYSQFGIFKGNIDDDLTKFKNWKLFLKPKLKWTNLQADAVGSPMNLIKLVVLENDEMIFLSKIDGFGILKDNKLIMTN